MATSKKQQNSVSAEAIAPKGRLAELREKIAKKSKKNKAWKYFFTALWGIGLAAWVGVALLVAQYAVAFVLVKILPEEQLQSNVVNSVYQAITYAICLVLTVLLPWKIIKAKTSRNELGLHGVPTWTDVLLAPLFFIAVLLAANMLMMLLAALLPGTIDWQQAQETGYSGLYRTSDFVMAFACLVILAPVCEEIIFRGWLYGKLRTKMSALPAILITSILFGLMHGQWNVGVTVAAMSIGMCVQRELTGTIWSGMLVHIIKNGLAFYLLFVAGMQ